MARQAMNSESVANDRHACASHRAVRIEAADGFPLALRHYSPQCDVGSPRAAIFLCATAAKQGRFSDYARFLASRGWHAVTFDYRSIGESVTPEGAEHLVSMRAWGREDLSAVIDWTSSQLGDPAIALVTHSIGGQIVPLARNVDRVRAMLAVSVQKGYYRLWPTWRRYAVYAFFRFYVPFFLRMRNHVPLSWAVSHLDRLERGVAEDYARWTLRPDYVDDRGHSLHDAYASFVAPILSLSFDDDVIYAPKPTVDRLFEHFYRNAPVLRAHVTPKRCGLQALAHSGFFRPDVCPVLFWEETESWLRSILAGVAPLPFHGLPAVPLRRGDVDAAEPLALHEVNQA
jgi:predicted alpha/beta hydrolase